MASANTGKEELENYQAPLGRDEPPKEPNFVEGLAQILHLRDKPVLYDQQIHLPALPAALDGLRIVHLSDFHRSLIVLNDIIEASIELAMQQQPDLIALTGDYVTGNADKIRFIEPLLRRLHAPLGVWAVLGNHDHYTDNADEVKAGLLSAGARLLENESQELRSGETRWWIAGVDDQSVGKANLAQALDGVPRDEFTVLLSHCPDFALTAAQYGVDLQLSGHTHGPQIGIWPFSLVRPPCGRKYVRGINRVKGSQTMVYTNTGIGVVSLPLRIKRPPEVGLLTLRRLPPSEAVEPRAR